MAGAGYVRGFIIPDVAQTHLLFAKVIRTAEQVVLATGGPLPAGLTARHAAAGAGIPLRAAAVATLAEMRRAYVQFNDGLRAAAQDASANAVRGMRDRLTATQVRPDTDSSPHLRDLLVAQPLSGGGVQTGAVGVALVSQLERAINRRSPGYGSYWRAQEYGTGAGEVPSQVGRVIFGYFMAAGGGDATPPQAQYAGGGGPHPIFQAAGGTRNFGAGGGFLGGVNAGPRGGRGGFGTIGVEIAGRHFIRFGADAAAVLWREQIAAVQARAIEQIAAITV